MLTYITCRYHKDIDDIVLKVERLRRYCGSTGVYGINSPLWKSTFLEVVIRFSYLCQYMDNGIAVILCIDMLTLRDVSVNALTH